MPSHIFVRLGLWDEAVESNRRSYAAGVHYAQAQRLKGVSYSEFHAMDYMVYGYLQPGRDSAARTMVAKGLTITEVRSPSPLLGNYNRIAMEARLLLERGEWRAAAQLPVRTPDVPVSEMLSRFARGVGAARLPEPTQLGQEVEALQRIEQVLASGNDSYWSRIAGINRQALHAWVVLASGDTTEALREAKAAAELEDGTEEAPVTPGELIPARELEADMHLVAGHYEAACAAYLATLKREPGRARSVFGAARVAELGGDRALAAAGYRDYLRLMERADAGRGKLRIARAGAGKQ